MSYTGPMSLITVRIQGRDIYWVGRLPEVPRKGDIIWLKSLTLGVVDVNEVVVSKVEWARSQQSWATDTETEGIHVWLTVRRVLDKASSRS